MGAFTDRTGEVNYNTFGSKMIIIEYRNIRNIDIYFPEYDCFIKNRKYKEFKKGSINCPYERRTCGVGYLGEGKYKTRKNNKKTKCYRTWRNMLTRCFDEEYKLKHNTYLGVTICEEWLNFQVFAEWYYNNIYFIDDEEMNLDKDILNKGNKVYSPETCIFVPQRINKLFTKTNKNRNGLPVGVFYNKKNNNYVAGCSVYNLEKKKKEVKRLGSYSTPEEAFEVYKQFKESYIKQVADYYKDKIPTKLYDAMYRYEVEIDD